MKIQPWLKLQNSASCFTMDLLQVHHDSHSQVHWAQQNSRRIKVSSVWCLQKDWAPTVAAWGQQPWGIPTAYLHEGEQARAHPTNPAQQQGRLGGQSGASPSLAARHICGDRTGLRPR